MFREEPQALDGVSMLLVEVHLSKTLQMSGEVPGDLRKFQDFFEYIFVDQGFRFFYHHANQGWARAPPTMIELGARRTHCCYEIGLFRRVPSRGATSQAQAFGGLRASHSAPSKRSCAALELPPGTWVPESSVTASGRAAEAQSALGSALFRRHKFALRSVPWVDYPHCGERGYALRFEADSDTCKLQAVPTLLKTFQSTMQGKTIVFAGDSLIRQLYGAVRNALIMENRSEVKVAPWKKVGMRWASEAEESTFWPIGTVEHEAMPIRLRFYPVYVELVPNLRDLSWLLDSNVTLMNIGAFSHDAQKLEVALRATLDGVDAAIRVRRSASPRLIWREYLPAHFPNFLHGADDGPGEMVPSNRNLAEWQHNITFHNRNFCTSGGVSAREARDNWRLALPARLIEERRYWANSTQWEIMPLFDALWDRPDGHWRGPAAMGDCRHWCQFSGLTDLWLQIFLNAVSGS